jgi:hypothetical protein
VQIDFVLNVDAWSARMLGSLAMFAAIRRGVVLGSRLIAERATQRLKGAPITVGSNQALVSGSLQSFLDTSDKVVLTEWLV